MRGGRGDGDTVGAGGLLSEPRDEVGGVDDLALGLGEGLAVLEGEDLGDLGIVSLGAVVGKAVSLTILLIGEDQLVPLPQKGTSAGASCGLEELGLGGIGTLDGLLEVLEGAVGDLAEDGGSGGLKNVKLVLLGDPFAVDEGILNEQARVLELLLTIAGQRSRSR